MGIFSVNVIAFAMPFQAYFNPAAYGGTSGVDLALWAINFVLIDGKMRGLFTLLFGASMLLVLERAEAAGLSPASIHYRRMAWLLVFGLLHYYLIWFGDILTMYALVGMVAFAFRKAPTENLVLAGLGFLLLDALLTASFASQLGALEAAAHAPNATADQVAQFRGTASFLLPPWPEPLARDLALFRSGYGAIVHERVAVNTLEPLYQLWFGAAETLGSMLLGMAALKSGFLAGRWEARHYRRIAAIGFGLGIPAYAVLAWRSWDAGFAAPVLFMDFFVLSSPFRLLMMFGYAALIILLARNGGWLARRVGAAGRVAFTNYLGTSLIASLVFYGYGLDLYGRTERFEAWLLAPALWILMLLWSKPWLDRFRYGPFEWLWRSLARGRLQPMRKKSGP